MLTGKTIDARKGKNRSGLVDAVTQSGSQDAVKELRCSAASRRAENGLLRNPS